MVYLDRLAINRTEPVDSMKVKKNDQFRFKINIEHPEIFLIRTSPGRFLTLLPLPGENITIHSDYVYPGKKYTLTGSVESEKIRILNEQLNITKSKLEELDAVIEKTSTLTDAQALEYLNLKKDILKYQRDFSIRFIIENLKSVASIYAIYQTVDKDILVLGENRDIQYMKILADSISVLYPDAPLVKSFVNDARSSERRYYNMIGLSGLLREASSEIPDIALPDISGDTIRLSSLKGKTVLLYFWASFSRSSREQNPPLQDIYSRYKNRGFEVFAVSLDNMHEEWEKAVRVDELNWLNVSELKFPNSEAALRYNVTNLPVNFLINKEGEIIARDLFGRELEKWLSNLLN